MANALPKSVAGEETCARLLTDAGRHDLAHKIESIILYDGMTDPGIQREHKPNSYAEARHDFISNFETQKWKRIHERWAQGGEWDKIRATLNKMEEK